LFSQGRAGPVVIKILVNYIGIDYRQCRYIRGRCSYVCRTKQGRKTLGLWGISWYQRTYNVLSEVLHKPRSL